LYLPGGFLLKFCSGGTAVEFVITVAALDKGDLALKVFTAFCIFCKNI